MVKYGEAPSTLKKKDNLSWTKTGLDQSVINYLFSNLRYGKIPRRDWNCSWNQGGGKNILRKLTFSCSTFYSKIWQKCLRQCFNRLSITRNAHEKLIEAHSKMQDDKMSVIYKLYNEKSKMMLNKLYRDLFFYFFIDVNTCSIVQ